MTVNDVYNLVQYIVNKEQNGYLTPDEFNLASSQAENSYQSYLIGEVQQYQYQRGQSRIHYGLNEIARQKLTPTIKNVTISIAGDGKFTYPTDYIITDALLTTANKRIRFASQDKLYSYLDSTIDPIASNPIYVLEQTNFHFYPESLGSAKLSYVSTVVKMVWGFTLDGNGLPIYNSGTSVQPVWDDTDIYEVIARLLKIVSENLQDVNVMNYANQITEKGQ
jgi:hypothetical protein